VIAAPSGAHGHSTPQRSPCASLKEAVRPAPLRTRLLPDSGADTTPTARAKPTRATKIPD
jgi:hypothetical protein